MISRISAGEFLERCRELPFLDVRSGKEYRQGHIPGALNLPLFDDNEREVIGTLYKNSGKETSVIRGLEFAGQKLSGFIKSLNRICPKKQVLVHCWRGGMRSESMAWLFSLAGYEVFLLEGGYKSYRQFIRESLSCKVPVFLIGGLTGTGKTAILHDLERRGEQILDLEALACHKGSVFGSIGQPEQPTNEQFWNNIYRKWSEIDPSRIIWIEDESRKIGTVSIPDPLYEQMNTAPVIMLETKRELRIRRLVEEYSIANENDIREAVIKISEKLGGGNTKAALEALGKRDFPTVADLTLVWYDKSYKHALTKRKSREIINVMLEGESPEFNVTRIVDAANSIRRKK